MFNTFLLFSICKMHHLIFMFANAIKDIVRENDKRVGMNYFVETLVVPSVILCKYFQINFWLRKLMVAQVMRQEACEESNFFLQEIVYIILSPISSSFDPISFAAALRFLRPDISARMTLRRIPFWNLLFLIEWRSKRFRS